MQAVDGAALSIAAGEVVGLVGESGSGKSVSALAVLRLLRPPARIVGGRIDFDGRDLLTRARGGDALGARVADLHGVPEPADLAQSRAARRPADRAAARAARRRGAGTGARARGGDAPRGGHRRARAPGGAVRASALGRHVPARDDRDGAGHQPAPAHRRRADDRARRLDRRPDPRAAARPGAAHGRRDPPHHPRPRRGRPAAATGWW